MGRGCKAAVMSRHPYVESSLCGGARDLRQGWGMQKGKHIAASMFSFFSKLLTIDCSEFIPLVMHISVNTHAVYVSTPHKHQREHE